jgi:DNA polymerase-3 subunit alpha
MPDIDMDFCIYLREFVINHVIELYGKDNVSQIITFGTYAARAAIRAVGRALAVPYAIVDKVAKLVPFEPKMTINKALDMSKDLRSLYTMNTHIKTLIDHALAIEGLPSSTSTHAAGVLICPGPVTDYVPVWVNDGVIVEQFNMNEIEELGLLKMDFLGLRNLSVINQTLKWIKANHGETITHKELLETIYDKRSYILLGKGLTAGIFQMEGEGMTQFMMQLKPQTFEEWTAGIALYRPGPMGFIPTFLANRDHPENIKYLHPKLEPILAETYGVITYQEQCMFIAVDLAGYSQADSDDFRRAISKKKKYLMELHQGWFIKGREEDIDKVKNKIIPAIPGAIHCQISEDTATEIFNQMMDFASYAFNKSHAAAYAVLGCETGWLKYVYPVEFMASLMTSVSGDLSKVGKYIRHCERDLNIRVLPPDINISTDQFVPTKSGEIRFGLTAAKNVGENVIKDIIKEREINGKFKSFTDFINRTSGIADKQTIESLIRCGAFDFTGEKRAQLLYILDDTAESAAKQRQKKKEGQMKLFWPDMNIKDVVPDIAEYPKKIYLSAEKEILGIYVSGHPLDAIKVYADKVSTIKTSDLVFPDEDDNPTEENIVEPLPFFDGQTVRLVCIITKIHTILDKHNNQMAFVTVEDLYGSVELVVFASLYDILKDIIVEDNIIEVNGRISVKDNGVNILPNTIQLVDIKAITKVYAQISSMNDFVNVIMSIKGNSGSMPVYVLFNNWSMLLPKQYWTNDQGIRTLKKNNINVYLKEDQV